MFNHRYYSDKMMMMIRAATYFDKTSTGSIGPVLTKQFIQDCTTLYVQSYFCLKGQ